MVFCRDKANAGSLLNLINEIKEIKEMLANVGKCWPTFLIQLKNVVQTGQHFPTCTNIRQHLPTFANKVNKPSQHVVPTMLAQCWPTCCDGLNRPLIIIVFSRSRAINTPPRYFPVS